jgi:hypothetical protein
MCSACGFPARPGHWTDAGLISPQDRVRAGLRRAEVLARVLRPFGLSAHAAGDGIVLSTLSGASEVVANPAEIWPAVERLARRRFDPLAP